MERISKKKRKSGYDYRKEKEANKRKEAASSCVKITSFCTDRNRPVDFPVPSTSQFQESHQLSTNIDASAVEGLDKNENDSSQLMVVDIDIDDDSFSSMEGKNCSHGKSTEISTFLSLKAQKSTEEMKPCHSNVESNDQCKLDINRVDLELEKIQETDFFKKPAIINLKDFFFFHPIQPLQNENLTPLPYDTGIYYSNTKSGHGQFFKRNWISYNIKNKKLYCSVCLAYSDGSSVFCQGFNRYRHITQTVGEHEKSLSHLESVKCFVTYSQNKSIKSMLFEKQLSKRKKEVAERRKVMHSIIDTIKLIGKQGLAYRGHRHEEAYSLDDPSLNHGNFLEILLLLSNYNDTLENHIKNVVATSKAAQERRRDNNKKGGRGNQISFLSKTTITKIIDIIKEMLMADVTNEIKQAVYFSVMMDTTIDVSGYDQCAIVVRYVFEKEVKEKLIGLKTVQSTTGEGLFQTLQSVLQRNNLNIENCIADSFDGASNMNGEYKGVSAKLKDLISNHIHTWCYAHVLNLVMSDVAQCVPETISFFGLLQETQVFFKESHKRLTVYTKQNPKIRLTAIGATRWKSRSDAAKKIFGASTWWFSEIEETGEQRKAVYVDLVVALSIIGNSMEFNSKTRNEANSLLAKFLSFETVLVSMIFLRVFNATTPLSDYLQTKNLDYAQAWSFVAETKKSLEKSRNEFEEVLKAANRFVVYMTEAIERKLDEDISLDSEKLCIEFELPRKRIRHVKRVHGESQSSEDAFINLSEEDRFKIKVFNVAMDRINQSIETRFADQKDLYLDLSCFDPRRFKELRKDGLPSHALDRVCSLIEDVDRVKLKEELLSLVSVWSQIKSTLREKFEAQEPENGSSNDDSEEDEKFVCKIGKECKMCIKCVFNLVYDYNMYSVLYTELYKVFKFLLTIPLTQVSCERAFSTLKLIKTRLRSSLSQTNLEALLLMQIERKNVSKIDNELIINKLCEQSAELKRLLVL